MAFPEFYTPDRIGTLYAPQVQAAVEAGLAAGLTPGSNDTRKIYLLLIDMQVDFIHPDGNLSVPGAVEDTQRVVEWIYTHAGEISKIGASLDSHLPIQIFYSTWWQDADGRAPSPYTVITSDEVRAGKWQPRYEREWSFNYVEQLEDTSKKQLMIWPFHTMIGTPGQTLVPALYEAIAYHSAARQTEPYFLTKGMIAKSEYYSAIEPEVKVPGDPNGDAKTAFMDELAQYDLIYVAGQAKSHCVLETTTSLMRYYPPEIVAKIRVLEDGMSSVAHPVIDFDALADEQYARFAENGLTLTRTTAELV
ncbi:MAG: hypothetical protein OHK0046_15180 [Anaerolineae bacterium]